MEYILTYWLRKCNQIFPMDILHFIVNTLLYQAAFAVERDLKIKDGDGFLHTFARRYSGKARERWKCNYIFKLLLIGERGVRKTSLILRIADDYFSEIRCGTVGADFRFRTINIDGQEIKLMIWNTAGRARFGTLSTADLRGTDGVILVYDVTNRDSFEKIRHWNKEIHKHGPILLDKMLIGNERDLKQHRVITAEEGAELAVNLGASDHMETSAKTAENTEKAIDIIASRVLNRIQRAKTPWI